MSYQCALTSQVTSLTIFRCLSTLSGPGGGVSVDTVTHVYSEIYVTHSPCGSGSSDCVAVTPSLTRSPVSCERQQTLNTHPYSSYSITQHYIESCYITAQNLTWDDSISSAMSPRLMTGDLRAMTRAVHVRGGEVLLTQCLSTAWKQTSTKR